MKKVAVLFCSKNRRGKTAKLLSFYLKKLKQNLVDDFYVNLFYIYNFKILSCTGCGLCALKKGCVNNSNDDFLNLINLICKFDLLVVASNVFFSGLPSHLKAFADRCEQFYVSKKKGETLPCILNSNLKEGHLVLTGGNLDKISFISILKCVKQFFWCLNINLKITLVAPKTDNKSLFFLVK